MSLSRPGLISRGDGFSFFDLFTTFFLHSKPFVYNSEDVYQNSSSLASLPSLESAQSAVNTLTHDIPLHFLSHVQRHFFRLNS